MPRGRPRVVFLLAVVLACNGSPHAPSDLDARSGLDAPAVEIRVMTFNIRHGIDGSSTYNLETAIGTIAQIAPDVVALQELTRNHPFYACDDQPARIARGLRAATGRAWQRVYHQTWFTQNTECRDRGKGDDRESEGLGLFSPFPLTDVRQVRLPFGAQGLAATVTSGGVRLPVIVTHLASGGAKNRDRRTEQIGSLLLWSEQLGAPRALVGDFNAEPGSPEMGPVFAMYRDAWADAVRAGTARGVPSGLTHSSGRRVDYVLYAPGGRMELLWAETVDTRSLIGLAASDHEPVVAAFRVR